MLSENIKRLRKAKGLSQEELAVKLNVVRQTVSKWEQGLSVPDADLLIALSEAFETSVSTLLGDAPEAAEADTLKAISEKLEVINLQLAQKNCSKRRVLHWVFVTLAALMVIGFAVLFCVGSPYRLGLVRPRDRRFRCSVPRIRVHLRSPRPHRPHCQPHWLRPDEQERLNAPLGAFFIANLLVKVLF